jgi:hypothetical protein
MTQPTLSPMGLLGMIIALALMTFLSLEQDRWCPTEKSCFASREGLAYTLPHGLNLFVPDGLHAGEKPFAVVRGT